VEDPPTVEYVARFIAGMQQRYTQRGGARPFGASVIVAGFDPMDQRARLWMTDPAGIHTEWRAVAIGRAEKTLREFLAQHWAEGMTSAEAVKLAVRALLEVVQTGARMLQVAQMEAGAQPGEAKTRMLDADEVAAVVAEVEREKEMEAERRRGRGVLGGGSSEEAASTRAV